jgi:hypothetical protein
MLEAELGQRVGLSGMASGDTFWRGPAALFGKDAASGTVAVAEQVESRIEQGKNEEDGDKRLCFNPLDLAGSQLLEFSSLMIIFYHFERFSLAISRSYCYILPIQMQAFASRLIAVAVLHPGLVSAHAEIMGFEVRSYILGQSWYYKLPQFRVRVILLLTCGYVGLLILEPVHSIVKTRVRTFSCPPCTCTHTRVLNFARSMPKLCLLPSLVVWRRLPLVLLPVLPLPLTMAAVSQQVNH